MFGFASDSRSKLLLKLYVSLEQQLNNLVRYAGEFPADALKVNILSNL